MHGKALSKPRLARIPEIMAAHVERGDVAGTVCVVSRREETFVDTTGRLRLDSSAPLRRDSLFRIASITKTVTAVAALSLVEECKLRLDDPVDPFLPELENRRVLRRLDGPLDDTVPAVRAITLRDLLTCRMGLGTLLEDTSSFPIQAALSALPISTGPALPTAESSDAYIRAIASLPLMAQPGARWIYDTSFDVLGVLLERVTGKPLDAVLRERIFEPLAMRDTAFSVPPNQLDRFTSCYVPNAETRALELWDAAVGGKWSSPPRFASGASGLVSTADDCLAFGRMLLGGGKLGSERILSRPSVALLRTDHITAEQKRISEFFPGFWDNTGWGFGAGIVTRRDDLAGSPDRYGWDGGYGTSLYVDPSEELVGVFLSQRLFDAHGPSLAYRDFWTLAYQAIED